MSNRIDYDAGFRYGFEFARRLNPSPASTNAEIERHDPGGETDAYLAGFVGGVRFRIGYGDDQKPETD